MIDQAMHQWLLGLPVVLVGAAVYIFYAGLYKTKVVSKFPKEIGEGEEVAESECGDDAEFQDQKFGTFSLFEHSPTCLWAFFCTPVLAAKNYEVSDVMGFWPSCLCL